MLLVEARLQDSDPHSGDSKKSSPPKDRGKNAVSGSVFLQNAETIRLVRPDGRPVSVVDLKVGDTVLCRTDAAGRHFGLRINEEIQEG
jgi:3-dehydroquinate synthase class II